MFIREATEEDYQEVRQKCIEAMNNDMLGGFGRINFIDYSKYLDKLEKEFKDLIFKQETFGLNVDKKEK